MQVEQNPNSTASATAVPSLSEFLAAMKKRGPRSRHRTSILDAHSDAIDEILKAKGSAIDVFQWLNLQGAKVSMSTVYKYVAKRAVRHQEKRSR
jgi:hypothetical protein